MLYVLTALDLFVEHEVKRRGIKLIRESYYFVPSPQELFHPVVAFIPHVVQVTHSCEGVRSCVCRVELSGNHPTQLQACHHPIKFVQAVVLVCGHVLSQVSPDNR